MTPTPQEHGFTPGERGAMVNLGSPSGDRPPRSEAPASGAPPGPVLVVDDSLTARMDLTEALEAAGFPVLGAPTLAEARALLERERPALVLLDLRLPDGDGIELLDEIRNDAATHDVPVIMLSGRAEVADRIRGLQRGADDYVGKPYNRKYVVSRAAQLLGGAREAADPRPLVLVVDDSEGMRLLVAYSLEGHGYRVLQASNGEEGLRLAALHRPSAVVVDHEMPGIDGSTMIRRMRSDRAMQDTVCMLFTGSASAPAEMAGLEAGADAYVRKDSDLSLVVARLGALLRARDTNEPAPFASSYLRATKVLCVDDSATFLHALADDLRGEGYEVVTARSGPEALDLLDVDTVDCVLLDRIMPGMNGIEVCRSIKGHPALRNLPVLMLTAMDEPGSVVEGLEAGAEDYVVKGSGFDIIRGRLRAQLRRRHYEEENRRMRVRLADAEMQAVEAKVARELADERARHLDELAEKNAELARSNEELVSANRELEAFAHTVSHDLRGPLRAIHGFCGIVQEEYGPRLDDEGRRLLSRVAAGATHATAIVDDLLRLSTASLQSLDPRPVDLAVLARGVLARLAAQDRDRKVEAVVAESLRVHGDPGLLNQAIENLVGNAWKYSRNVPVARIEVGETQVDGARTFYVRDNGAGFDMAYVSKVFEPFQRLHTSDQFEGTGIGLATVRRIVERHAGRIWADSEVGAGTTFSFTLGLGQDPDESDDAGGT